MNDAPTLQGANRRLLGAGAALTLIVVAVPLLIGPLSAALVPACPPDARADARDARRPHAESATGRAVTANLAADIGPPPGQRQWQLFGEQPQPPPATDTDPVAEGDARGYDLFGGGGAAAVDDDSAAAPSILAPTAGDHPTHTTADDTCSQVLPDDLPSAGDLTLATLVSLLVGFIAALVATTVGASLGLLSGYRGGLAEWLVVRGFANGLDALPQFVLLVTAAALYRDLFGTEDDTRLVVMAALIGLVNSTQVLLIVHHQTRLLTARKFVIAARLMGWGPARVVRHKILPHLRHELLIPFTQLIIWGVFMETALSYIGFSPTTRWPTLGAELYRLEPFIEPADLGPAIVMCVLTVSLAIALRSIGDALEARSVALDGRRFAPEGET